MNLGLLAAFVSGLLVSTSTEARTLHVCPVCNLQKTSQAATIAQDGDTIEIEAGDYVGDTAIWRAHNLTLRGVKGRPHLIAQGDLAEGKAVWVVKGNGMRVANIEISGAKVLHRNGAAIRLEGRNLTLEQCYFHDNENGLLTGDKIGSTVRINHCEFSHNGYGDGQSHNIYVGRVKELIVTSSYLHHANVGHNLKSRAARTEVRYSFLGDEDTGNASYEVDLPEGGDALLVGNILQKGNKAENSAFVTHGVEAPGEGEVVLAHNTVVNSSDSATVFIRSNVERLRLVNNLFYGHIHLPEEAEGEGNMALADHHKFGQEQPFVDPAKFDFHLLPKSTPINAGVGLINPAWIPRFEYKRPVGKERRTLKKLPDAGAYEYQR
jgi:hypothetical protein